MAFETKSRDMELGTGAVSGRQVATALRRRVESAGIQPCASSARRQFSRINEYRMAYVSRR